MADRIPAEIWIGGPFPRHLLEELPISDLRLDWDENWLPSTSEADILASRDENGWLHFAECEAAWGEFQELENWLRTHKIPFRRQSAAKYDYSAELVEFRPDLPGKRNRDVYTPTTPDGVPVVTAAEVEKIADRMARLAANRKQSPTRRLQTWEKLVRQLMRLLPPRLPPLPPFEITDR